jgi:hypothetical protein
LHTHKHKKQSAMPSLFWSLRLQAKSFFNKSVIKLAQDLVAKNME